MTMRLLGWRPGRPEADPYAELRQLRVRMVFRRCSGPCGQDTWMAATSRRCRKCGALAERLRAHRTVRFPRLVSALRTLA
ncbi:hypothetical protein [Gandjariella thermophila]|uniref:hypothetical protein n=1 Tax=Gandjariella thermophila TaxID=1931992 RepID=UPI0010F955FF|nr:hypothetical protein [Gandjariella thermophila]